MKDLKNTIAEIVKIGLAHSIAQAFLIFSGVLVIFSVLKAREFVFLSFITLFYALINFKMEALRRHESLGRYAGGSDPLQIILFTITSFFHLMWWIVGAATILFAISGFPDKFVECFGLSSIGLFCSLVFASVLIFATAFIMTIVWLWRMLNNKKKAEKGNENYKIRLCCKNCPFEGNVRIACGKPIWDQPCPRCGLYNLEKCQDTTYTITASCENCGESAQEVEVPKGLSFKNPPCPNCEVADLKK